MLCAQAFANQVRDCCFYFDFILFFVKRQTAAARRVARIWKRGGYFERVRSVQTTLTRIFIDLESASDGLSEI